MPNTLFNFILLINVKIIFYIFLSRKAASVLAKHPTRIKSGEEARKLVSYKFMPVTGQKKKYYVLYKSYFLLKTLFYPLSKKVIAMLFHSEIM